jgi:hypothetical protein
LILFSDSSSFLLLVSSLFYIFVRAKNLIRAKCEFQKTRSLTSCRAFLSDVQCSVSWRTRTARDMAAASAVDLRGRVLANWQQDVTVATFSIWHVVSLVYQGMLEIDNRSHRNIMFHSETENASQREFE